ncbi:hypothetical protein PoB_006130400 [Plakobranchus ocellatus]|uniref:Uncharacterized protein n=1 Tax=Plakobranchus ocellatus TaxID=259542 RepID=A0AAV4CSI4_9GAST|nr:hypothetical protein PoB_006130400 [Plakobranchus ocellatus]
MSGPDKVPEKVTDITGSQQLSEESKCRSDCNEEGVRKDSTVSEGPVLKVSDNLQREIKDRMLQLARRKAVPVVTNCEALEDPRRTRDLRVPIVRREIGGREVDVM